MNWTICTNTMIGKRENSLGQCEQKVNFWKAFLTKQKQVIINLSQSFWRRRPVHYCFNSKLRQNPSRIELCWCRLTNFWIASFWEIFIGSRMFAFGRRWFFFFQGIILSSACCILMTNFWRFDRYFAKKTSIRKIIFDDFILQFFVYGLDNPNLRLLFEGSTHERKLFLVLLVAHKRLNL